MNRGAWRAASPARVSVGAAAPSKHNLLDATPDPLIFWERVKLVHPLLDKVFKRFGTLDDGSMTPQRTAACNVRAILVCNVFRPWVRWERGQVGT